MGNIWPGSISVNKYSVSQIDQIRGPFNKGSTQSGYSNILKAHKCKPLIIFHQQFIFRK